MFNLSHEIARDEYRTKTRPILRRLLQLMDKAEDGGLTAAEQEEYERLGQEDTNALLEVCRKTDPRGEATP